MYLKIDDDINRLKNHFELQNKVLQLEKEKYGRGSVDITKLPKNQQSKELKSLNHDKVILRFCS